ncbi:phBC6A51 family helix-turn-helix protein [Desulfobacter curvatus]|uniref:phBC6A51 family helix-turn-helix protein n=1 Tax=Desulfobacter curvatus TaxID=2290 RepID=UPI0003689159|nr:phBC6A51 family helix-turn-helix protein [Desulfobacter curvatus]
MAQNIDESERLSASQLKGVQALLTAPTVDQAAQKAGVGRTTLYRWLKDDVFIRELNQAKRRMIDHHLIRLQRAAGLAIDTLTAICRDKDAPAGSRVAAAREILAATLKARELEDLQTVMEKLKNSGFLDNKNNGSGYPRR